MPRSRERLLLCVFERQEKRTNRMTTHVFSFHRISHCFSGALHPLDILDIPDIPDNIALRSRCLLPVADLPLLVEIPRTCHAGVQNAAVAVADYKISAVGIDPA